MEYLGILSTGIVLLSFIVSGEKRIRIINIIGAVGFVVYGILISALSVWLLNACLIGVHVYKLIKIRGINK